MPELGRLVDRMDQFGFSYATILLLTHLLSEAGYAKESIRFVRESSGKPRAQLAPNAGGGAEQRNLSGILINADNNAPGISVSHAGVLLACAVNTAGEIGIDVESCNRTVHEGLALRLHHPDEHLPSELPAIRIWTIKEAVLKLLGTGLRTRMNSICLEQKGENNFQTKIGDTIIDILSVNQEEHWFAVAYPSNQQ